MAVNSRKPFSMAASKRVWKACPVIWNVLQMKATVILSSHMKLIWIFFGIQCSYPIYKGSWLIYFTRASSFIRSNKRPRSTQARVVWKKNKITRYYETDDTQQRVVCQNIITIYYETNPPAGWAHQKSVNRAPSASGRFPSGELAPSWSPNSTDLYFWYSRAIC